MWSIVHWGSFYSPPENTLPLCSAFKISFREVVCVSSQDKQEHFWQLVFFVCLFRIHILLISKMMYYIIILVWSIECYWIKAAHKIFCKVKYFPFGFLSMMLKMTINKVHIWFKISSLSGSGSLLHEYGNCSTVQWGRIILEVVTLLTSYLWKCLFDSLKKSFSIITACKVLLFEWAAQI